MEVIKDTIAQVMREWQSRSAGSGDEPDSWLKKILTKSELRHIKFRYFKKGVLGLSVDSSTRLYYLNAQKAKMLSGLKKQSDKVRDIRFHIGELE